MAKTAAIEIAVRFGVEPFIVNVRKFQSPIIQQFTVMQIFRQAEHLVDNAFVYKLGSVSIKEQLGNENKWVMSGCTFDWLLMKSIYRLFVLE